MRPLPIRMAFDVACTAEQAFATWTSRISAWWPRDHTVSGDPACEVIFEPGVGGRVLERTGAGREIEWGHVVEWQPPARLAYVWHLGSERHEGTDVEVTFTERSDGTTRVELVHDGWERLGTAGEARRDRNVGGWAGVTAVYMAACVTVLPS